MSAAGLSPAQNAGREGCPKIAQRRSGSNCTHGTPAGLPCGMPGMGDVIDGAVQQAPQSGRQENSGWADMAKVRARSGSGRPYCAPSLLRRTAPRHPSDGVAMARMPA